MRDLNKVMLIGNLTRDPELRSIPSGQSVASFGIATNRSWNNAAGELQKAVEFMDVVAWGKLGEIANQILKKGRRTYVEGRLQTRNWEGQDGIKRYKTEVIASDLIVLDRPAGIGFDNNTPSESIAVDGPVAEAAPIAAASPVAEASPKAEPVGAVASSTDSEIDIEDIPF